MIDDLQRSSDGDAWFTRILSSLVRRNLEPGSWAVCALRPVPRILGRLPRASGSLDVLLWHRDL